MISKENPATKIKESGYAINLGRKIEKGGKRRGELGRGALGGP